MSPDAEEGSFTNTQAMISSDDGPVDIDTGEHAEIASTSVPSCVKYSSATSETELLTFCSNQECMLGMISAIMTISGIGKIFALPSQEACDVDKYMDASSIGDDPCMAYDVKSNVKPLPKSLLPNQKGERTLLDPNMDPFAVCVGKTLMW
jgi:hypothetical protein